MSDTPSRYVCAALADRIAELLRSPERLDVTPTGYVMCKVGPVDSRGAA